MRLRARFFHQADFDEATAKITEFEAMITNLEGVEHLNNRKNELATEMRENKKRIMDINVGPYPFDVPYF